MVHGVQHGGIPDPLVYPQLDADPCVKDKHGRQGQQEQCHQDEGGVRTPVGGRVPALLAADVLLVVQEVVLHLRTGET